MFRSNRFRWLALAACCAVQSAGAAAAAGPAAAPPASAAADADADWPRVTSAIAPDPALEARIARILAGMTLAQKVGQMTQAEIRHATPEDVRRHALGSVLNGGGSWPGGRKHAGVRDWLRLAERYHAASMATDLPVKVPVIWGTDAVHGHNNVFGATLFPHHIGLGAANDPALVREIGAATAKAVRATGIAWVFAPTLAVARDDRWGRTYESFSEDPAIVAALGTAYVQGLQGTLGPADVIATAKHFIGDGGTQEGRDQGLNTATREQMIRLHAPPYVGALGAGVQTVMASFHSWHDSAAGIDHGKMHGSRTLLTGVLKQRMGFDGFVVSDWNGIGQVPGCTASSCAQAINAGIDMVMVPQDWKAFIANTVAQVRSGQIPMARIDDAVTRILRVKLRAGLFERRPAQGAHAGDAAALQARALARRAVRQSLVLLKNQGGVLPLARDARVLVVGKSADSLENQSGGWSLTWQGSGNRHADFPAGQSVLAGLRAALGARRVVHSADGRGVDPAAFDAVIAVLGETPYAEGNGDIPPSGTLRHSSRHPEDLAVLERVAGRGKPVITVFVAGRPLWTNDLLNLSDAFVAAWLPGTEGGGVADVLLRATDGSVAHDFRGRLPMSWPAAACQTPLNAGEPGAAPLFALGHGLSYAAPAPPLGTLDTTVPGGGCGARDELLVFRQSVRRPYLLQAASSTGRWPATVLDDDPNARIELPRGTAGRPDLQVRTVQVHTQQDARLVRWSGPARIFAWSPQKAALHAYPDAALEFDAVVETAARAPVTLAMECGPGCAGRLNLTALFAGFAPGERRHVVIPLACFAERGARLAQIDVPFSLAADAPFALAFTNLRIAAGAARDANAQRCPSP